MSTPSPAFKVAIHAVMLRGKGASRELLLGLRQNTGYGDGLYCMPAGHQELFETSAQAVSRELREEVGVVPQFNRMSKLPRLQIEHLKDYGAGHADPTRRFRHYNELFFLVPHWRGEIQNREPDKCAELRFFKLSALPANMLPLTAHALDCLAHAPLTHQTRFGWDNPAFPAWRKQYGLGA
jgi:8-oxo-dGTP diphosphatase